MMCILFLIVMPVVKLISITILWFSKLKLDNLETYNQVVKAIGKWSMLDVYTLGFSLFLLASDNILPGIIHKNGYYFMMAYLVLNYALDIITQSWIPRGIEIAEHSEDVIVDGNQDLGDKKKPMGVLNHSDQPSSMYINDESKLR